MGSGAAVASGRQHYPPGSRPGTHQASFRFFSFSFVPIDRRGPFVAANEPTHAGWLPLVLPWQAQKLSIHSQASEFLLSHRDPTGGEPRPPSQPCGSTHPLPRPAPTSQLCFPPRNPRRLVTTVHNLGHAVGGSPGLPDCGFPFVPFKRLPFERETPVGFDRGRVIGRPSRCAKASRRNVARDAREWKAPGVQGTEREAQEDAGEAAAASGEPVRASQDRDVQVEQPGRTTRGNTPRCIATTSTCFEEEAVLRRKNGHV
eukprot:scaffold271_cov336-Pavlova_lutheri.AAC.9